MKVQAQHLQAGDVVGSGEVVISIIINSVKWPSNKICLLLNKDGYHRSVLWGKYTRINIKERATSS